MLQQAAAIISAAGTFVLPELVLSFYSDKEPLLLSEAKRIAVDSVFVDGNVLRLFCSGKELAVAINPDEETVEQLISGSVSALAVTIDSEEELTEQLVEEYVNKVWLYNLYSHKVFGWFLKAADKLVVREQGQHLRTVGCPVQMRVYQGKPYADFQHDCLSCMFCVDASEDGVVYCTGGSRLATVEDFKRTIEERKSLYDGFLKPDKTGMVARGICPQCGGALEVKTGENGKFLGCSHYPLCHFTAEKKQGGVWFNF